MDNFFVEMAKNGFGQPGYKTLKWNYLKNEQ